MYSKDLRERVVGAIERGMSRRAAARQFLVGDSTAITWFGRYQETGSIEPVPRNKSNRSRLNDHREWLLELIKAEPDLTLEEIAARLAERHVKAVPSAVWRFYERNGISLKKTEHAAEQDRPDVARAREEWRREQPRLDPTRLVFIDETGTATDMARLRGRGPRGQRVVGKVPYGHWKTTTFVAGLRYDSITAPFVIDRPMNGEIFLAYVRNFVAPTLKCGDIVVMDNLSAHKVAGVRDAIREAGADILYLPPYSPDLNPIEQAFAKLKALLRKAAERSVTALWDRIGQILSAFTAQECANYLRNAGYA